MNAKHVNPAQLCQALESALIYIGVDAEGDEIDTDYAYLLADDCYRQFAARKANGFVESLPESDDTFTLAECIEGVKLLAEISLTPWNSYCSRIVTQLTELADKRAAIDVTNEARQ